MKTLVITSLTLVGLTCFAPTAISATPASPVLYQKEQWDSVQRYAILRSDVTSEGQTVRSGARVLITNRVRGTNTYLFMRNGISYRVDGSNFNWE